MLHNLYRDGKLQADRYLEPGEPEAIFLKRFPRVPATLKAWLSVEAMRYPVSGWVVAVLTAEPDDPADIIRIIEGLQPRRWRPSRHVAQSVSKAHSRLRKRFEGYTSSSSPCE